MQMSRVKDWNIWTVNLWCIAHNIIQLHTANSLESCALNVASLPKNEPLLVINRQLALPDSEGNLLMNPGEKFNVSCAGNKAGTPGFESLQGEKEFTASCVDSGTVEVKGQALKVQDLGCKTQVKGEVLVNGEKCGGIGTRMELGFRIRGVWYGIVQVCHHNDTSATLYTSHQLYGASLPAVARKNQIADRPKFQDGNVYKFKPNSFYKKTTQAKTLASTLGGETYAEKYLQVTFLARGHLAPNSDFVLDPYQDVTYFYINAAPQWQVINNGNWKSVERRIRHFAKSQRKTFNIITGTYGVLSLEDSGEELQEIWLYRRGGERRLPVPKFYWKVVHDPQTRAGIAFVSLNLMRRDPTAAERLCEDVCDVTGWTPHSGSWRDNARGYVYCCDVAELRQTVEYLPPMDVQRMLAFDDGEESDEEPPGDESEDDGSEDEYYFGDEE